MCNGYSTRISQGGSVAVLRSINTSPLSLNSDNAEECRLLFSNHADGQAMPGTHVELKGFEHSHVMYQGGCWIVIHHDGDLSASSSQLPPTQIPTQPFFSFSLNDRSLCTMRLSKRLDLGVGDSGIIGRRVSVVTSSMGGPLTVAEGIIGWN